jgi:aspartate/methionine/tyrosine aminotransferase
MNRLAPADGAFYIYADVSRWTDDSTSWCARMLAETGVATVPGVDFDPVDGGKFIRMCFAGGRRDLERAVELLSGWLR